MTTEGNLRAIMAAVPAKRLGDMPRETWTLNYVAMSTKLLSRLNTSRKEKLNNVT